MLAMNFSTAMPALVAGIHVLTVV